MKRKIKETIDIKDAIDNLNSIASIDLQDLPPLGVVKKYKIVTSEEEFGPDTLEWLSSEGPETILDLLDLTYRTVHSYLLKLYEDSQMNWNDEESIKGTAAIMDLVGESAEKMGSFFQIRMNRALEKPIVERDEFKALQRFYLDHFVSKFPDGIEGEKAWATEWEGNRASELLDLSKTGLKDFEVVKKDSEYELFYIRNEDFQPYFDPELLRNIKLSCNFDLSDEEFEEDPLLKIRSMQDRDLHATARQILKISQGDISDFYKIVKNFSEDVLANTISMAIIALFLAANPRCLIQNTAGKSCMQYFEDFHRFLRIAMRTTEYQKLIAYPPHSADKVARLLLYLTNSLCREFFQQVGGIKLESIGLIHRAMRKGEEDKQKKGSQLVKGETVWNQFLIDDEKYRTFLAKFPNGPLFKILDLIRKEQGEEMNIPFDPLGQENFPLKLFEIEHGGKKIEILKIPSPTVQNTINKVEVADEFLGFLRSLSQDKPLKKHLMIQLQDRNSWKECARSHCLEMLQMNAEFSDQLVVITLPKDSRFYHQSNEYLEMNQAKEFIEAFREQLKGKKESGYFFPVSLEKGELDQFINKSLPLIHKYFFHNKNSLTRRNREDFIEIFYQFFILKCIDMVEPTSVSFSCKDAIDIGSAASGAFYGLLRLLNGDFKEKEHQEFLRWLLYTPALFVRERAIDAERLNRTISLLECVDGEMAERGKQIVKDFGALYPFQLKGTQSKPIQIIQNRSKA